jgi:hypothetical protein
MLWRKIDSWRKERIEKEKKARIIRGTIEEIAQIVGRGKKVIIRLPDGVAHGEIWTSIKKDDIAVYAEWGNKKVKGWLHKLSPTKLFIFSLVLRENLKEKKEEQSMHSLDRLISLVSEITSEIFIESPFKTFEVSQGFLRKHVTQKFEFIPGNLIIKIGLYYKIIHAHIENRNIGPKRITDLSPEELSSIERFFRKKH